MNKSEKFWDRAADRYDHEEKMDSHTYLNIIEKTKKYLKTTDTVLDLGCGTGLISNEIAGSVKLIHGIDISSKMIDIARKKADARKIKNIDYAHAAIFDERYKTSSFDVIMAFYILHLLEDADKVMERMNKLLKPEGLIISATPCLGETKFLKVLLSLLSKTGLIPKARSFKISELQAIIANGGFKIVRTECLHKSSQQYLIVARKIN